MNRLPALCGVLAGMVFGVLMGTAPASAWHGAGTQALTIDPITPTTVYATTEPAAVVKSTDGGANWSGTALTVTGHVPSIAIDPLTPTTVYVATDSGVLKSTDGGATWGATGLTDSVSVLAIDPHTPTTIYAAGGWDSAFGFHGGVFKSTDGAVTWQAIDLPFVLTSIAVDPVTPTTIYSGTIRQYIARTGGVLKSTDGGATWAGGTWDLGSEPWPSGVVFALAIDPVIPTTLYAGATRDWVCAECESDLFPDLFFVMTPGGAFKSTDGGVMWQAIGLTDVQIIWALAVNPMTTTTVYAGTDLGLFKSTDGGANWRLTSLARTNVRALAIDPFTPTTLYAGTESGVFKSIDGGETWSATGPPGPTPEPPDTASPDTSISSATDSGGAALPDQAITLFTSVTLTFTGTDDRGLARFECRLDGAGFSACTSPLTYSGLALGRHTVEVRAIDTSNNADPTPARLTWTVDAPPDTSVTSAVDARGKPIANGGITTSRTITLRFTGTDNGAVAGFECRLDAGNFTLCASPMTYNGVSRGTHTFQVRAIDSNGFRDPTPAIFKWTRTNDD